MSGIVGVVLGAGLSMLPAMYVDNHLRMQVRAPQPQPQPQSQPWLLLPAPDPRRAASFRAAPHCEPNSSACCESVTRVPGPCARTQRQRSARWRSKEQKPEDITYWMERPTMAYYIE